MRPRGLFVLGAYLALALFLSSELVIAVDQDNFQSYLFEEILLSVPSVETAKEHVRTLSLEPRVAGTIKDYEAALYVKDKLASFGQETELVPFESRLTYPAERSVRVVHPFQWTASLKEDSYAEDPQTSSNNMLATFNAYTPNANVSAHVIYVNYGRIEDYQDLLEADVPVQGAIVIARYGVISRMAKVLLAQVQGAAGVLLFSDPAEFGWVKGPVFPDGPWGPASRVEMGSVLFSTICPGNPTHERLRDGGPCINEASPVESVLPDIPVQPLSWWDAYPILSHLAGPTAPANWQGGMNFTYHLGTKGATEVTVDLLTISNFTTTTTWNVIGTLRGTTEPDKEVLLGNHRDSWRYGAGDPATGTAILLEVARSFAWLMNSTSWRPTRTIKFFSWDAEEYAFIGSTHYAESNRDALRENAIAYLNVDLGAVGPDLWVAASPSFRTFIFNATRRVPLPDDETRTVYSTWSRDIALLAADSDYAPFIHHVGIASIDVSFRSTAYWGIYHSIYDNFYWLEKLSGGMPYLKTCAQLYGLMALRMASDILLPFNYTDYGIQLTEFAKTMSSLVVEYGGQDEVRLDVLMDAIKEFNSTAAFLQSERRKIEVKIAQAGQAPLSENLKAAIKHHNDRARLAERNFTTDAGLESQGRPWWKHLIQAPALFNGKVADPLPGLARAIRDQNWPTAVNEVYRIAECVTAASVFLRDAPPIVDEYAGPIMAMRIASVAWGCMAFFVLLGLTAFFIWRFITYRHLVATTLPREYQNMFEDAAEATPLTKV